MEKNKYPGMAGQKGSIMLIMTLLFVFTSCAKKIHFATSAVVPAATGLVKVSKDRNKNYEIQVEVSNLASPERLTPPKKVYVVWLVTRENATKNIGQLVSSGRLFSKSSKASLKTISPYNPLRIFITAEYEGSVLQPGSPVVLDVSDQFSPR